MRMLPGFVVFLSVLTVQAADPSETACPAKCAPSTEPSLVSDTAKKILNNEYLSGEDELLDLKDEALQEAEDWLLDEDILNGDIQDDVGEGKDRLHELLDEVDTTKAVADGKNIFTDMEEWFDAVDLDSSRSDADAEISNLQTYIENYKSIKDDFVENNLPGLVEDFVSLGGEYVEENLGKNQDGTDESLQPKIDQQKKSSRGKRARSRLKSTMEAFRNQYQDDIDEKRAHYEGLREKYQENIDDFKAKKDEWREWARSWKIREGETIDPDPAP